MAETADDRNTTLGTRSNEQFILESLVPSWRVADDASLRNKALCLQLEIFEYKYQNLFSDASRYQFYQFVRLHLTIELGSLLSGPLIFN